MCWQRGSRWEGLAPDGMGNYSTSPEGTRGMCSTSSAAHTGIKRDGGSGCAPHPPTPARPGQCPLPPSSPICRVVSSSGTSFCLPSRRAQPSAVLQSTEEKPPETSCKLQAFAESRRALNRQGTDPRAAKKPPKDTGHISNGNKGKCFLF